MSLPKYFENLTIGISTITGQPRIISVKQDEKDKPIKNTDKYKDIDGKTWHDCIMLYFQKQNPTFEILDDFTFLIAGKVENKEQLLKVLKGLTEHIEGLEVDAK